MFCIFAAILVTRANIPFTIGDSTKPFGDNDYLFLFFLVEPYWHTIIAAAYPVCFEHKQKVYQVKSVVVIDDRNKYTHV